jgi:hypothetical protein
MKERSRRGCVVWGGLGVLLLLLFLGAGWWFFLSGIETADAPPSGVFAFLLTPVSGDEVEVGDYVLVSLNAFGLSPLLSAELFVNGQSLGMESGDPENAYWTWQPLSIGIHTLMARVTDINGEAGQSQTVIVNVLQGDGLVQVSALEGQTLEEIGAGFGVPPVQMASANPNIDPEQPLPDGALVQVPVGDGGAGNGSGQGGEGVSIPLIFWEFTPLTPVDKSYCYTSSGDGNWVKIPKKPFDFFSGSPLKYIQQDGIPKGGAGVIQVQCWGWLGETLKFLGQGETKFDVFQPADNLEILGQGFQLTGKPQIPLSGSPPETGEENTKTIPPPFALREPADTADCTKHFGNILAGFVCDALLNASVKQYRVLQWEWEPKVNLPGNDVWLNEIDGYHIYEIDPLTNSYKFLADIKNPKQKAVAVPLPWGPSRCYHIWAYVNDPVIKDFGGAGYCPGQPPAAQKITVSPATHWLTTGGAYVNKDCGDLNPNVYDPGIASNYDPKFGQTAGEVQVGAFMETYKGCNQKGHYYSGVKFSLLEYPIDGVISKAVLKFSHRFPDGPLAVTTGVAYKKPTSCVANVGKAKQDWGGAGFNENHYLKNNILAGSAYYEPMISLSPHITHNLDVTSIVKDWYKHPNKNHGFILGPASVPYPQHDDGGRSVCMSWLGNFELEIHYFVP